MMNDALYDAVVYAMELMNEQDTGLAIHIAAEESGYSTSEISAELRKYRKTSSGCSLIFDKENNLKDVLFRLPTNSDKEWISRVRKARYKANKKWRKKK